MILLQNAVRGVHDLRMVETLDEFQTSKDSSGASVHLKYTSYCDLLINACIRYDKTRKANVARKSNIYMASQDIQEEDDQDMDTDSWGEDFDGIDTPSEDFYQVNTTKTNFMSSKYKGRPRLPLKQFNNRTLVPHKEVPPRNQPSKPFTPKYDGPIYLPSHLYNMYSKEFKDALAKHNPEAIKR